MNRWKTLKVIHLASTIWLVVCVGYLLVLALHQAGLNWLVIFSLSGHSALLILLLVSLYLFAIFGATGKGQRIAGEHPLTSTGLYMVFYVSAPLLGAVSGVLAIVELPKVNQFLSLVALGTFAATFLTWVIIDPLASMLEMLASASREHRLRRLAADKHRREERRREREAVLERLFAQQEQYRRRWQILLAHDAEKLTELLMAKRADFEQAERQAVDIGVHAWQIGGVACMRQLRDMTLGLYKEKYRSTTITDHISNWWDGVGSWRSPAAS